MIDEINKLTVNQKDLIHYLALIIGSKIYRYDFVGKRNEGLINKIIFNGILSVIIGIFFMKISVSYIEKLVIPEMSFMFMSYWFSLTITTNLFQIDNLNQLDEANKIILAIKEVALNFIIFAGLATISNLKLSN